MPGLDWAFIGVNVFLDMYDSIQNDASFGSVVAGSILVDIFLGEWLDELIDKITQ